MAGEGKNRKEKEKRAVELVLAITAQKDAEQKILNHVKQLENAMQTTLQAVAKVVEAHDPYTAGHELRVGQIAADIAREMGWSEETCQTMQLVGLVHDIGKMSIPGELLTKPGKLSAIEFELIKTHAENGYEILKDVKFREIAVANSKNAQMYFLLFASKHPRGLYYWEQISKKDEQGQGELF